MLKMLKNKHCKICQSNKQVEQIINQTPNEQLLKIINLLKINEYGKYCTICETEQATKQKINNN